MLTDDQDLKLDLFALRFNGYCRRLCQSNFIVPNAPEDAGWTVRAIHYFSRYYGIDLDHCLLVSEAKVEPSQDILDVMDFESFQNPVEAIIIVYETLYRKRRG